MTSLRTLIYAMLITTGTFTTTQTHAMHVDNREECEGLRGAALIVCALAGQAIGALLCGTYESTKPDHTVASLRKAQKAGCAIGLLTGASLAYLLLTPCWETE